MAALPPRIVGGWTIFCVALEERLVYRGDFALGTLMRFLPMVTQIFLWWAIFDTIGGAGAGNAAVAGYAFPNVVAYYLLSMVSRAFSSMPGLASGIALQIRNGEVKRYLVQPVDLLGFLLLTRLAHKLAYYSVAVLPFALVFLLCHGFFVGPAPDGLQWACFLLALPLSLVLGFFLEACIGLLGFWFLEVSALLFIYMLFNFFLSGHMFPLDMMPPPWHAIVNQLPLKYLAYYPAAVLLGKVPHDELLRGLLGQCAWILVFIVLARVMFWRGVRRYAGYGG